MLAGVGCQVLGPAVADPGLSGSGQNAPSVAVADQMTKATPVATEVLPHRRLCPPIRLNSHRSFPRKRESSLRGPPSPTWMPAFAGMTATIWVRLPPSAIGGQSPHRPRWGRGEFWVGWLRGERRATPASAGGVGIE